MFVNCATQFGKRGMVDIVNRVADFVLQKWRARFEDRGLFFIVTLLLLGCPISIYAAQTRRPDSAGSIYRGVV